MGCIYDMLSPESGMWRNIHMAVKRGYPRTRRGLYGPGHGWMRLMMGVKAGEIRGAHHRGSRCCGHESVRLSCGLRSIEGL